jgi:hypothetical protein
VFAHYGDRLISSFYSLTTVELFFFRSWQAAPLVTFWYYLLIVLAFFSLIWNIVIETIAMGAGGFFLGLLFGLLSFFFIIISGRVACELVLSVFSIRDNIANPTIHARTVGSAPAQQAQFSSAAPSSTAQYQDL